MKSITLYTKPVVQNKKHTVARGRMILSKEYREAKQALAWEIATQWKDEILTEEGIAVNILIYYKGRRPDIDAYEKILLDAMEGLVYSNDGLIDEKHTFRIKDIENPRTVIQVL